MKTEVKYLGNTEGELFTSWHYVAGGTVGSTETKIFCGRHTMMATYEAKPTPTDGQARRHLFFQFLQASNPLLSQPLPPLVLISLGFGASAKNIKGRALSEGGHESRPDTIQQSVRLLLR